MDFFSLESMVTSIQGLFIDGFYPVLTFIPFLLAGLAIGRLVSAAREMDAAGQPGMAGMTGIAGLMKGLLATGAGLVALGYGTSLFVRTQTGYTQSHIDAAAALAEKLGAPDPELLAQVSPEQAELLMQPPTYNPLETQMGTTRVGDLRELLVAVPHSGSVTEIVGGIGVTMILIALMFFAFKYGSRFAAPVLKPLAELGRASLTYYIGHIVVLSVAFLLHIQGQNLFAVLLVMVMLPMGLAHLWFGKHKRGPLEQAMHKLSAVK